MSLKITSRAATPPAYNNAHLGDKQTWIANNIDALGMYACELGIHSDLLSFADDQHFAENIKQQLDKEWEEDERTNRSERYSNVDDATGIRKDGEI